MSVNRQKFDKGSFATGSTSAQSVGTESRENLKNLTSASEGLPVQVNQDNPLPQPFLLLKVNMEEGSDIAKRRSFPEFSKREPVCLEWRNVVNPASTSFISLTVTNLGQVASDAVRIHYQFVYCTYRDHARDQGFTIDHAFEAKSDEKSFFVDFVPASSNRVFLIPYPIDTTSFPELKNLYFRARVSTLWEAKVPIENWDFATDPKVTEATKVFP
ncbi:hypothetical protein OIN59_12065 [Acidovorax sp. D2M1]|uniref:Uncharacterized protein n=1 Tax=Acidovorax benzenivorans TaxID=2987520 RepID=A0ABT5RWU9_9BURK|nr:hypothetical protein [Acidovorax benzenivorans]MDD2178171.1 hypothetical protein [Acidovorax benzenivorans]